MVDAFLPSERVLRQRTVVDQEKISAASISVAGSGYLADFVLFTLRGLDVGAIHHYPGAEEGFQNVLRQGESLEEFAARMNFAQEYLVNPPHSNALFIDTEEQPTQAQQGPYLRPAGNRIVQEPMVNETVPPLQAGVLAGLLGTSIVNYCEGNDLVLGRHVPLRGGRARNVSALVVGAGATGTYVALQAAIAGFTRVDVMDGDGIAEHNLNRQVLYYAPRRDTKAETLSDRIALFGCDTTPFPEMFTESTSIDGYDVVFSCVDRYAPRRMLDSRKSVILVDGGTGVHGGRVHSTVPDSPRLSTMIDLTRSDPEEPEGCTDKHNPSIIMPNMIIGSYMVDEALALLAGDRPRVIRYDAHTNEVYHERIA